MRFRNLLDLPYDVRSNVIDVVALRQALPSVPDAVLRQVLSDHGRKEDFQRQYGGIDLQSVKWRLLTLTVTVLIKATVNPDFENWVNCVSARLARFEQIGWKCIDGRDTVVSHWRSKSTWAEPPVFLQNIGKLGPLHLMEGHTRLGILRGALSRGLVSGESLHSVWLGLS